MEQIRKIVTGIFDGVVKNAAILATRVTKEDKEIVILKVDDNVSLVLVSKKSFDNFDATSLIQLPVDFTAFESSHFRLLENANKKLLCCLELRNVNRSDGAAVVRAVWSRCHFSSIIMYAVALRHAGALLPSVVVPRHISKMLVKFARSKKLQRTGAYACDPDVLSLSIDTDVRVVSPEDASDTNNFEVYAELCKASSEKRREFVIASAEKNAKFFTMAAEQTQNVNSQGLPAPIANQVKLPYKQQSLAQAFSREINHKIRGQS